MSSGNISPPTLPQKLAKKNVRFFNVSLRNGIVMSTPAYQAKQAFVAHLIRALETSNPDFAWVQFLFVRSDYGTDLVRLKNSMNRAKTAIEQPSLDLISGEERDRKQLYRDYYRRTDTRMKKVDDIVTKPTITMAIQGMWVSDEPGSITTLPFDHCMDEHDSLAVFQYRDPRMLVELVDRRMVEEISEYLSRYTGSRLEPPSFIVTPEELRSYIHLPAGEGVKVSLHSLKWGTPKKAFGKGKLGGEEPAYSGGPPAVPAEVVRMVEVPAFKKVLDESATQPLDHLASASVRTFELVYGKGKMEVILSARSLDDMGRYVDLFNQVYGELELVKDDPIPVFLQNLPAILATGQGPTRSRT
jgi:hypothetical protein